MVLSRAFETTEEQQYFSLRLLYPLLYLIVLVYGIAAIVMVPFGLPVLRQGATASLVLAMAVSVLCIGALGFVRHTSTGKNMTQPVRKAAMFSASVTILSFATYIVTTAYFSIKPAIPIINNHNYDLPLAEFETWLFGGTLPGLWLVHRINEWQVTALDIAYNAFMPGLALSLMAAVYVGGLKGGVRFSVAQFIGLFVCLFVALLFPTRGPAFLYPEAFLPKLGVTASGNMAHYLLTYAEVYAHEPYRVPLVAGLAAMPSYHVFSWACGLMYWRYLPRPALQIGILACALDWLSTVGLGWHYVLDGAVSLLLVLPVWWLSDEFIRFSLRLTPQTAGAGSNTAAFPAPVAEPPLDVSG